MSTARFYSWGSFKGFQISLGSIQCSLRGLSSWILAFHSIERRSIVKAWILLRFGGQLTTVTTIWNPSLSLVLGKTHKSQVRSSGSDLLLNKSWMSSRCGVVQTHYRWVLFSTRCRASVLGGTSQSLSNCAAYLFTHDSFPKQTARGAKENSPRPGFPEPR